MIHRYNRKLIFTHSLDFRSMSSTILASQDMTYRN